MPSLRELLEEHNEDGDREREANRPPASEQLQMLKAAAQRHLKRQECRFQIGDIITPVANADVRGSGHPFVVIEERYENPIRNFDSNQRDSVGSNSFGRELDIRVVTLQSGGSGWVTCPWWVESWMFEYWKGESGSANVQ